MNFNINWFKENLEKKFSSYKLEYGYFKDGDFGDLYQVSFENTEKGGVIDFWSENYLGVYLYDYRKDDVVLNLLLKPEKAEEKEKAINQLISLL
jgi:hypothetical protein